MTSYIHFTKSNNFALSANAGDSISQEYGGLFVYEYDGEYPLAERQREWAYRDAVIIRCPAGLVEFIQDDPLGNDKTRDEYLIPTRHFNQCRIVDILQS